MDIGRQRAQRSAASDQAAGWTDTEVVRYLRCPVCRYPLGPVRPVDKAPLALRCPAGHSFDVARQGYVDLTGGRVTSDGDTAQMVAARRAVLRAGHFDFLTEALVAAADPYPAGLVVDVGAGTGDHLAALVAAGPERYGLAVDVSRPALRRAARVHPKVAAVRADVWRGLPIADHAAVLVLDVFAPRDGAEFARLVRPDGGLIVVTPAPEHLRELRPVVSVDPEKEQRLTAALGPWFEPGLRRRLTVQLRLSHVDAAAVLAMGPSARHLTARGLAETVDRLPDPVDVTASVWLSTWRPRG